MSRSNMVQLGSLIKEKKIRNREQDCAIYSVTNSQGFVLSGEYFTKAVYSNELSGYKVVPYGAFAYNPSRINVGSVGYQNIEEKVAVSPLYSVFTLSNKMDPRYLLGFLKSDIGLHSIRQKAHGSVRDVLRISDLNQIEIPCPSMDEQVHVAEMLTNLTCFSKSLSNQLGLSNQLIKSRFCCWAVAA